MCGTLRLSCKNNQISMPIADFGASQNVVIDTSGGWGIKFYVNDSIGQCATALPIYGAGVTTQLLTLPPTTSCTGKLTAQIAVECFPVTYDCTAGAFIHDISGGTIASAVNPDILVITNQCSDVTFSYYDNTDTFITSETVASTTSGSQVFRAITVPLDAVSYNISVNCYDCGG